MLAVSGLHVGVIFLVCNFFFSLFLSGNLKRIRLQRAILVILFLWLYAFVTGFSPSVVRASVMFSFLQFGFLFQRPYYVYSSVFASAFLILLFDSSLLFDVGFQLSYLALLSILIFQKPIYSCLGRYLHNDGRNICLIRRLVLKVGDWAWTLTSVSLAAQIGTAPIVLYYFHQFSLVFGLSGLVVIPLATLIIYLSIAFFFLSWVPCISNVIVSLLSLSITSMNSSVSFLAHIPFSYVDLVDFKTPELIVSYLCILFLVVYMNNRLCKYFIISGISFCILLSIGVYRSVTEGCLSLVVCNTPGNSIINLSSRDCNLTYSTADSVVVRRQLKSYWINNHSDHPVITGSHVLCCNNVSVFVLDRNVTRLDCPSKPFFVDFLVISNDIKVKKNLLSKYIHYKNLIVDSSCSSYTAYWWQKNYRNAYIVEVEGDFIKVF